MSTEWRHSREGGSPWLMRAYVACALRLGRGFANFWLGPITAYFLLVRSGARAASRAFLAVALSRPARLRDLWRHFRTFAQVTSDRIFLLSGRDRGIELQVEGVERLGELLDRGNGCLLLGSHLGSFEAARVISARRPQVTLRILMDRAHNATATRLLARLNPDWARQIIDSGLEQTRVALGIGEAIRQGHLVAMLADRVPGSDRTADVTFMGRPARLPITPYLIARMTGAPLMLFFALYLGGGRYRLIFEELAVTDSQPRAQPRIQFPAQDRDAFVAGAAQAYADRLSHYATRYPYNWFNFYRYWNDPEV